MKEALGRSVELSIFIGHSRIPVCRCAGLDVVCRLGRRPGKFKQQRVLADPERHSGMCAELFSPSQTQSSTPQQQQQLQQQAGISSEKNLDSWWMHVATTFHKEELLATGMFSFGATVVSLPWKENSEPFSSDDIDPAEYDYTKCFHLLVYSWAADIPRKRPRIKLEDAHGNALEKSERSGSISSLFSGNTLSPGTRNHGT